MKALAAVQAMALIVMLISYSCRDSNGQVSITGHLGIELGMTNGQLKAALMNHPCISKTTDGQPVFEQVPLKPYYRTFCRHSPELNSEITIWIKPDTGVEQIRESFGGQAVADMTVTRQEFSRLKTELSKQWGKPSQENQDLALWKIGDRAAILRLIPPDRPLSLPVLKIVVSNNGLESEEMRNTISGKVF